MLLGGDELGRTQGGNNNAWCQDNEISWFDWEPAPSATRDLLRLHAAADRPARARTRCSGARHFLAGHEQEGSGCPTSGGSAPTAGA